MTPRVVVVGLGPAGPDLVTSGTVAAIEEIPHRFVRTMHHPAAPVLGPDVVSFDDHYEQAADIEDVYRGIVATLVERARAHGEVLYAVPGSPQVAERSVALLLERSDIAVQVHPALSFADLAWARLGVDPVELGARLVDGRRFAVAAAGATGPLLVAQCDTAMVLSQVKLAVEEPPTEPVTVLWHLGLADERLVRVRWEDLDRTVAPDQLTSLWIPALDAPVASELVRFDEQVRVLRGACPWDAEQTHGSLRRYLLEETYEVLEVLDALDMAIRSGDETAAEQRYGQLEEELGDLLYQVFFHAVLAAENGRFTVADVARGIHDKLERRHPHVFASARVAGVGEVMGNWEQIKQQEKPRRSLLDGVPPALPALAYAAKALGRVPGLTDGLDAPTEPEEDVGDQLLAVVERAREAGLDAESALRRRVDQAVAARERHARAD